MDNDKLKQFYKKYLLGKKYFQVDKEKAYEYFKESLIMLEDLKKNKIDEKIIKTELECKKYLTESLEYTLETETCTNLKKEINYDELLISIEKGDTSIIKKYKYGEIDFSKLINEQTLLHYAVKMGDTSFLSYAFKIGANIDISNKRGHSILEFACMEQDPNMINFLMLHGANMSKYLHFRDGKFKYLNMTQSIDNAILLKIIMEKSETNNNCEIENKIENIKKYFNLNEYIGLNNYSIDNLLIGIKYFLNLLELTSALTYLNIIEEELEYDLKIKLGCPKKKIDIILVNIIPFIDYPFNLSNNWILSLELKYLIIKLIKNNPKNIKNDLVDIIWEQYIKTNLVSENYIGTLVFQWITKIKV